MLIRTNMDAGVGTTASGGLFGSFGPSQTRLRPLLQPRPSAIGKRLLDGGLELIGLAILFVLGFIFTIPVYAEPPALLDGNFISNPSFEFDYHHNGAEGHAIAFMGDWSFNSSDLKPDYCDPSGDWGYADGVAHTGTRSLLLKNNGSITRGAVKVAAKGKSAGGDSRWGNPAAGAAKFEPAVRLATTVRGSVWYKGTEPYPKDRTVKWLISSVWISYP
ncbi:MAG: hypothetical protein O3B01_30130 [Planctomycetota bacterium]|nr:hypothetical protein [Planctomycetota bacterium]MDA1142841.1 hypothetical protein [Planctomycetota bacterium]